MGVQGIAKRSTSERSAGVGETKPIIGGDVGNAAKARAVTFIGRNILDRYRIEGLVAMGGIAAVFRASKLGTGQEVAIKILHPEAEDMPELIERLEREAVAGKHIYHPNVAAVHEIDKLDDGSWFLVQEFIRGKTLREHIDGGPMPPERAAKIARQLAAALNAAHDLGIIHRDVKPRNIMLLDDPADQVKLIDFGLAKVPIDRLAVAGENTRNSLTQAGVVFGTVAYMAPEAALGMRVIDRRADLYALGVILYEMLSGKHPFTATEPAALFAQHRKAAPPPIAERSPGIEVPPALEAVVRRLLEKDPDERYPYARSVMVALDAVLEERKPPPPEIPVTADTIKTNRASLTNRANSNLTGILIIGAVVIVGAILIIVALFMAK
jgi:serine/threonine-protein kinase